MDFRLKIQDMNCAYYEKLATMLPADMAAVYAKIDGGAPAIIIQDADGDVVARQRVGSADEILAAIKELRGGGK